MWTLIAAWIKRNTLIVCPHEDITTARLIHAASMIVVNEILIRSVVVIVVVDECHALGFLNYSIVTDPIFVTIYFVSIIVIIQHTILPDQIIEHSFDIVLKLYQLPAAVKFDPHFKELRV